MTLPEALFVNVAGGVAGVFSHRFRPQVADDVFSVACAISRNFAFCTLFPLALGVKGNASIASIASGTLYLAIRCAQCAMTDGSSSAAPLRVITNAIGRVPRGPSIP